MLVREKEIARDELKKYVRHMEFIETMEKYSDCENIDWNCYWSWFYHSNISADEALHNATTE